MKTKLTLSLDEDVIEQAKAYAKDQETSVSSLVENYLKAITSSKKEENEILQVSEKSTSYKSENTPLVKKMRGLMGSHELTGNERLEFLLKKYG
ncbi:MAG: DUF6364 family protein [Balneola sp.]